MNARLGVWNFFAMNEMISFLCRVLMVRYDYLIVYAIKVVNECVTVMK